MDPQNRSAFLPASSNADFSGESVELQSIQTSDNCDSSQNIRKRVKRARTMPSVTLYRPPAARKLERNGNLPGLQEGEIMTVSSQEKNKVSSSPEESKEINPDGKRNESNETSVIRNAVPSIRSQNKVPKCKSLESPVKKIEAESRLSKGEEISKNPIQTKQRRPDIQVYVPKGRRSANSGNEQKSVCENKSCKDGQVVLEEKISADSSKTLDKAQKENIENKFVCKLSQPEVTSKNDDNNFSIEMNRDVKRENSESITVKNAANCNSDESRKSDNSNQLNPDECDWESMFDDSGECLDPSLMEQLTSAVGEVTIEKPKSNYNAYKNKSLDMVADEFPHVIEIYNFPPEFQLQDLMTVFSQFKNSGFEIKWVDDTHALGIFSSSAIVSEVLDFYHPFVKTRSLKEGTPLSKMKARRSAEFLQPYKPRPETCSALARRLVTGALGVKLPTFREEREAEKKILTKAREKKRLEAKQRENAWEGTFS